jgi:aflatoxin B1 aldehyde reductase
MLTSCSPLAGGFLTGKVSLAAGSETLIGGRWEPGRLPFYIDAFDKPAIHAAVIGFGKQCDNRGVTSTEVSLRWIIHHSALGKGDTIVLGASSFDQLRGNVQACKKGPLDEVLLGAIEELAKAAGKDPPQWF